MSDLGPHILSVNDGNFDEMVMLKTLLYRRIGEIKEKRAAAGYIGYDQMPTVSDIEMTHVIIPRNSFKPFVPISSQYMRCPMTSGNLTWGGTVGFQIHNSGDFLWDMFTHITFNQLSAQEVSLPTLSLSEDYSVRYINGQGQTYSGDSMKPYVFYADDFGHRLFKEHMFTLGGSLIDRYTVDADIFYEQVELPLQKRAAYKRCIGQELPIQAYSQNITPAQNVVDFSDVNDPEASDGVRARGAQKRLQMLNYFPAAREVAWITNGLQTPKDTQPEFSIIYPYKFDWCERPESSLPLMFTQDNLREVRSTLAQQSQCVFTTYPILAEVSGPSAGTGTVNDPYSTPVGVFALNPIIENNVRVDTTDFFHTAVMYVNFMYIDSLVHDVFLNRAMFNIIRVHTTQITSVTAVDEPIELPSLKYALEYLLFGFRTAPNELMEIGTYGSVNAYASNWNKFGTVKLASYVQSTAFTAQSGASTYFRTEASQSGNNVIGPQTYTYFVHAPIAEKIQFIIQNYYLVLSLTLEGFPVEFFDSYTPFRMGEYPINGPTSPGFCMLTFSLKPGDKAPRGYLNASIADEIYIQPYCPILGMSEEEGGINTAELVAVGKAINVLYIDMDVIALRFE